jgi:hypothetical protein
MCSWRGELRNVILLLIAFLRYPKWSHFCTNNIYTPSWESNGSGSAGGNCYVWHPNGSVRFVCVLRYPHSRLTLSYCSSVTNSYFVTMEKISEQPEDHCFILQIKPTAGPFSLGEEITKYLSNMNLKYMVHIRDSVSWYGSGDFPVSLMFRRNFPNNLILTQKLLFDIQFVEFIRRVCDMSLSPFHKLTRSQIRGATWFCNILWSENEVKTTQCNVSRSLVIAWGIFIVISVRAPLTRWKSLSIE